MCNLRVTPCSTKLKSVINSPWLYYLLIFSANQLPLHSVLTLTQNEIGSLLLWTYLATETSYTSAIHGNTHYKLFGFTNLTWDFAIGSAFTFKLQGGKAWPYPEVTPPYTRTCTSNMYRNDAMPSNFIRIILKILVLIENI